MEETAEPVEATYAAGVDQVAFGVAGHGRGLSFAHLQPKATLAAFNATKVASRKCLSLGVEPHDLRVVVT